MDHAKLYAVFVLNFFLIVHFLCLHITCVVILMTASILCLNTSACHISLSYSIVDDCNTNKILINFLSGIARKGLLLARLAPQFVSHCHKHVHP